MIQIGTSQSGDLADWLNLLVAGLALLSALASLWLTGASVRSQDKHNRLSLRPLPQIAVGDYDNHLFVKIVNNGPGPMIINEIVVSGNGRSAGELVSLMPDHPPSIPWQDFVVETKGRSIRSGDELVLLALREDSESDESKSKEFQKFRSLVRSVLAGLKVEISFTDVYGTTFQPCERALTWFARGEAA